MSDVAMVMRRPSSDRKEVALVSSGPCVSMAMGTNDSSVYLVSLRRAADSAALPAETEVECRYDAAVVSATVTSHTRQRPSRHGISERPSGRLPSDLTRPVGSFDAGIAALVIVIITIIIKQDQSKKQRADWL